MTKNTTTRRLNKKQKFALLINADAFITNKSGEVWGKGTPNATTVKRMLSSGTFEIKDGLLTWNDGGLAWYVFTDASLAALIA